MSSYSDFADYTPRPGVTLSVYSMPPPKRLPRRVKVKAARNAVARMDALGMDRAAMREVLQALGLEDVRR